MPATSDARRWLWKQNGVQWVRQDEEIEPVSRTRDGNHAARRGSDAVRYLQIKPSLRGLPRRSRVLVHQLRLKNSQRERLCRAPPTLRLHRGEDGDPGRREQSETGNVGVRSDHHQNEQGTRWKSFFSFLARDGNASSLRNTTLITLSSFSFRTKISAERDLYLYLFSSGVRRLSSSFFGLKKGVPLSPLLFHSSLLRKKKTKKQKLTKYSFLSFFLFFSLLHTTQRKNTTAAQNNENKNNTKKKEDSEEEEQHFFDEDCHVVPEYVPVDELIEPNDVEHVSELYSSVNTGVEFFPTTTATAANVYVPTAKSQKRSSFEDFLGEFIGYEETIDDAIVPTF